MIVLNEDDVAALGSTSNGYVSRERSGADSTLVVSALGLFGITAVALAAFSLSLSRSNAILPASPNSPPHPFHEIPSSRGTRYNTTDSLCHYPYSFTVKPTQFLCQWDDLRLHENSFTRDIIFDFFFCFFYLFSFLEMKFVSASLDGGDWSRLIIYDMVSHRFRSCFSTWITISR